MGWFVVASFIIKDLLNMTSNPKINGIVVLNSVLLHWLAFCLLYVAIASLERDPRQPFGMSARAGKRF